jgi:putative salt-induced outer membrane protein YdiY
MVSGRGRRPLLLFALAGVLAAGDAARAQEGAEKKLGWASTAELSLLFTSGNAETESFGFRGTTTRTWLDALLKIEAAALRAEQTTVTRSAVGPPGEAVVSENEETELTAENYLLRGQYDHEITARFFVFGGASWEQNELAGLDSRFLVAAGGGHIWADREALKSRASLGLTYTLEEDVSGLDAEFLGLRATWDFLRKLTPTTTFTNLLILDENLDETSDYRADNTTELAVAMNERLALKISLRLLYDNEPSFVGVPREFPAGIPAGDVVLVQLDELDTFLSAALVVKF